MKMRMAGVLVAVMAGAAQAQVAPWADLTDGLPHFGTVTGGSVDLTDVGSWAFFTFSANAGDNIDIEVNRLIGDIDPASSVVFGDATGVPFASLTGTWMFDWSGPGLSATVAFGDDEDPPALPGPFGDPHYGFLAASTGVYTVAVCNYAGNPGTAPWRVEAIVTGSTAPAPGSLALLAAGGLLAGRRRRS
jgi:MYXO-CTERM domain-containing protein